MGPGRLNNLALASKLSCSDKNVAVWDLAKLTDGNKEAADQSIIFLHKGLQWVQMDFAKPQQIFAIVLWHAHNMPKVYHDVIVQAAYEGKLINTKGVTARYLRFYSRGSTESGLNEYTEIEVYGRPAK